MSDYFDTTGLTKAEGTRARAAHLNSVIEAIDDGFDLIEYDANRGLMYYGGLATGSVNAYAVTLPYSPSVYVDGMQVVFKANASNTGACTINVNAIGAKSIRYRNAQVLVAGEILSFSIAELRYNASFGYFELQN